MFKKFIMIAFVMVLPIIALADTFIDTIRSSTDDAALIGGSPYSANGNYINISDDWADVTLGHAGWRFTNVQVNSTDVIDSAFIYFQAYLFPEVMDVGTVYGSILGHHSNNSGTFNDSTDFQSRYGNLTTARDTFELNETWNANSYYYLTTGTSPVKVNIGNIVSEIKNISGWSSGNAMTILIRITNHGNSAVRRVYQYDYGMSSAARLYIYKTAVSSISATVSVTDTNGTSVTLSADLSGGSAPYDSVVYYFSSTRADVANLSARESLYTAASDPRNMTMSSLTRNTKHYFRVKTFDGGSGDTTAIDSITTLDNPILGTITAIDTSTTSFTSSVAYTTIHVSKLALVWDDSTGADSLSGRKDSLIITADFTNPDSGVALSLTANSPYAYWWRAEDDGGTTWSSRHYVRTNAVGSVDCDCPSVAEYVQGMINAGFARTYNKNGGSDTVNAKGEFDAAELNTKVDNLTEQLALTRAAADSANARARAARDSLNSLRADIKLAADTSLYVPSGEWSIFTTYWTPARATYLDNVNLYLNYSVAALRDSLHRALAYQDTSLMLQGKKPGFKARTVYGANSDIIYVIRESDNDTLFASTYYHPFGLPGQRPDTVKTINK